MKKRIIIGLAPIFVLIVAMGAYAILLFAKLGSQVDVVLRENYRSVVAGQKMKEAAERMDSAVFFSLVGEEQRGRSLYADYLPKFEDGLRVELGNITVPGEDQLAHSIQSLHARYSKQADIFWKTPDVQARRDMYFHDLLPVFTEIKDTAQAVISLNQDNMLKSDREARDLSKNSRLSRRSWGKESSTRLSPWNPRTSSENSPMRSINWRESSAPTGRSRVTRSFRRAR
jgi:hypothetical protein